MERHVMELRLKEKVAKWKDRLSLGREKVQVPIVPEPDPGEQLVPEVDPVIACGQFIVLLQKQTSELSAANRELADRVSSLESTLKGLTRRLLGVDQYES